MMCEICTRGFRPAFSFARRARSLRVPSAVILDGRALQSTYESGLRAGHDGYKRKRGNNVHVAVDTLGHLLAVHVTSTNEQERAQVATLVKEVQAMTGQTVKIAFADQGYTGKDGA